MKQSIFFPDNVHPESPNQNEESSQGSIEIAPKFVNTISHLLLKKDYRLPKSMLPTRHLPPIQSPSPDEMVRLTPKAIAIDRKQKTQTEQAFQNLVVKMNVQGFCQRLLHQRTQHKRLLHPHHSVIADKTFNLEDAEHDHFFTADHYMQQMTGTYYVRKAKRKLYGMARKFTNWKPYIQISSAIERLLQVVPVFRPESRFQPVWQFLVMWMRIYFLIFIPVHLAFNNQFLTHSYISVTMLASTVCLIDIVVQLNTGFFVFGKLCERRWAILLKQIDEGLFFDLTSILLVLIVSLSAYQFEDLHTRDWTDFLMLAFAYQGRHIWQFMRTYEENMNWSIQKRSLYNIMKLLCTMMYIEHVFSCIWSLIGLLEVENNSYSWIAAEGLVGADWKEQYLESIYFSTVTMTSVGYGDIAPVTQVEKIFGLFFLLISSVQLSFSVSKIGHIILELTATSGDTLRKIRIMNAYMRRQGISLKLKDQISEYLIRYWNQKADFVEQDHLPIVQDLSDELKEQLLLETTSRMITKITLIDETFSEPVKRGLCQCIESVCMQPENLIPLHQPDDTSNTYLYFLDQGKVEEVLVKETEIVLTGSTFRRGQHFGMKAFLTGQPIQEKYKSRGFSKLLRITRQDMIHILKEYPLDYEKFCMKRDELIVTHLKIPFQFDCDSTSTLKCSYCRQSYHSMAVCPSLHFVADRERIVKAHTFPTEQKQRCYRQRRRVKFQALSNYSRVSELAETYLQSEHNPYDHIYDSESEEEVVKHQAVQPIRSNFKSKVLAVVRIKNKQRSAQEELKSLGTFLTYQHEDRERQLLYWTSRINRKWAKHKPRYVQHFSEHEVEQLQWLRLRLNIYQQREDHHFDQGQNFRAYMMHNNPIAVLRARKDPSAPQNLLRFMFYPDLYRRWYLQSRDHGSRKRTLRALSVRKWSRGSIHQPITVRSKVRPQNPDGSR